MSYSRLCQSCLSTFQCRALRAPASSSQSDVLSLHSAQLRLQSQPAVHQLSFSSSLHWLSSSGSLALGCAQREETGQERNHCALAREPCPEFTRSAEYQGVTAHSFGGCLLRCEFSLVVRGAKCR